MKLTLVLLISSFVFVSNQSFGASDTAFCDKLRNAWDDYIKTDTPQNGKKLSDLIPLTRALFDDSQSCRDLDYTMDREHALITDRISPKNKMSLRIAFKLTKIADGDFAEGLYQGLEEGLVRAPVAFLEELKPLASKIDLKSLLSASNPDDSDDQDKQKYNDRIKALKSVKAPQLKALRDRCLKILMPSAK